MISLGQLKWLASYPADNHHTFIRAFYPAGFSFPMHSHDFYEVSIVETGAGTHCCNGHVQPLRENDIIFVHPQDEHAIRATADHAVHFVNIAFPAAVIERLHARYRSLAPGPWPWSRGSGEQVVRLEPDDRAWLASWCRELEATNLKADALAIELFVIDLWRRVARARDDSQRRLTPSWLVDALEALEDPRLLAEGIPALVRMTERCREHLGRLMIRHYGCTTVEFLANRRMAYAARQLLGATQHSIGAIAQRCGYTSVSHFHAKFRAFHHCRPEEYRRNGHLAPSVA